VARTGAGSWTSKKEVLLEANSTKRDTTTKSAGNRKLFEEKHQRFRDGMAPRVASVLKLATFAVRAQAEADPWISFECIVP
jgi:hypothetical protein